MKFSEKSDNNIDSSLIDIPEHIRLFANDIRDGLLANPKFLPCVYFYDDRGSMLFEKICQLPEYYLTRAETEILSIYRKKIVDHFNKHTMIAEFGSGSSVKSRILIESFIQEYGICHYTPIDVSKKILEESSTSLSYDYPELNIDPIAARYEEGIKQLSSFENKNKLIISLGSSIGNFYRHEAVNFLLNIATELSLADHLLIGIDLQKDKTILEKAYNDASGITAEFNLNILNHINYKLYGNFNTSNFRHQAIYNESQGRIEMYLVSNCDQKVYLESIDLSIEFQKHERIHTENSYKYSLPEIENLGELSGLQIIDQWFDKNQLFSLNLFRKE